MKKLALMLILAGMATACSSMDKGMSKSDDMMMQDKMMTSDMDKDMKSSDSMNHDDMKKNSMMMDDMQDDSMKKDTMMMDKM